ncbi:hypothetical protein QQ045_007365 [Rhodiola kirilowii]
MVHTALLGLVLLSISLNYTPTEAIRSIKTPRFIEAPEYVNGQDCAATATTSSSVCDPNAVHIAMTLDFQYLRGSVAAIHSVLKHASCPDHIFFHLILSADDHSKLLKMIQSAFPSLKFKAYSFQQELVNSLISSSIRPALDNPLNYARSYLAQTLDVCVDRVIYLDSDVIVVDDIHKLWQVQLSNSRVIGAPIYCNANFSAYFTDAFWNDPELNKVFVGKMKSACYFNTGVMVMDLGKWREGEYTKKIEEWMRVQKEKRIYELGSLPPFLLVFGGEVEGIEHRWNQHGLGGDNLTGRCRSVHPGPVSLLHWSGKGKPWARLDAGKPCAVDYIWAPYDLYRHKGMRQDRISAF